MRAQAKAAVAQPLVLGVGQRLLRRDRPRVAGVDAHRVEVLDRADDDAVAGPVGHHLELELLPALDRPLDEHLADRARLEPDARPGARSSSSVSGQAAARAAERERRPDDGRGQAGRKLVERAHDDAVRHRQPGRAHRVTELQPILGPPDRLEVGADQLDPEAVEHAGLGELDGEVERRLAAERRQQRVGPLLLDDRRQRIDVERLEYVASAHSGSVMIVAGFELTSTTR